MIPTPILRCPRIAGKSAKVQNASPVCDGAVRGGGGRIVGLSEGAELRPA